MATAGSWVGWLAHWAMWLQAVWFIAACVIAIPVIIWDEFRLWLTAPRADEVAAYATRMEAEHGRDALSVVGTAMYTARLRRDFRTSRFLKEVSGELVRRRVEQCSSFSLNCPQHGEGRPLGDNPQTTEELAFSLASGQKTGTTWPETKEQRQLSS